MRESSIERYFVQQCKYRGMKVIKMVPTFEMGIPDRQVLWKGVSGFAEIKAPGKKPRANQVAYMKALSDAGFYTGVVDSRESAIAWIHGFTSHGIGQCYCAICGTQLKEKE